MNIEYRTLASLLMQKTQEKKISKADMGDSIDLYIQPRAGRNIARVSGFPFYEIYNKNIACLAAQAVQ